MFHWGCLSSFRLVAVRWERQGESSLRFFPLAWRGKGWCWLTCCCQIGEGDMKDEKRIRVRVRENARNIGESCVSFLCRCASRTPWLLSTLSSIMYVVLKWMPFFCFVLHACNMKLLCECLEPSALPFQFRAYAHLICIFPVHSFQL